MSRPGAQQGFAARAKHRRDGGGLRVLGRSALWNAWMRETGRGKKLTDQQDFFRVFPMTLLLRACYTFLRSILEIQLTRAQVAVRLCRLK